MIGPHRILAPPALVLACTLALVPPVAHAASDPPPDPAVAARLSFWSTALTALAGGGVAASGLPEAGGGLVVAGLVLGPSVGYIYGGRPGRGLAGVGVRVLCGGFVLAGFFVGAGSSEFDPVSPASAATMLGGTAGMLGSAVYDIAVVGRRVRERNAARAVTLAPWRSPEGVTGLALRMRF